MPCVYPTLVVVSGPAGSGKTTLAHELARAIPCPAVCRDEIKEGMVHAAERFDPAPGDDLTQRTLRVFFAVIRLLLERRVSLVAEAAFQGKLWRPNLEPLMQLARLRIVQCHTDAATAWTRHDERRSRKAHVDVRLLSAIEFESCTPGGGSTRRIRRGVPAPTAIGRRRSASRNGSCDDRCRSPAANTATCTRA